MRPSAAEALKAAIRRSLPIAAILVLLGIVAVNAIQQVRGPRYAAGANVFHSTTDIGAILTDIQPSFVDPDRVIETALALARSPEVYDRAAKTVGPGRNGDDIRGSTTVSGDNDSDVIEFKTTVDDPDEAVRTVNAVATQYIAWRSEIFGKDIARAIARIEARLGRAGGGAGANADLREQLNRLRTLEALHSGGAVLTERASEAPQVSPSPVRDTVLGASFGFVIALLIAGLREAFNTRIRSEADIEDSLQRPVLATIETLPKRAGLVTVGRHESRYGDTYALLAANLMQIRGAASPTILAITSAIAGEGKTTTAANLAVAMAQRGQRVVLADFDLRKPSIGRMFRIPAGSPGVVQLVDGAVDLAEAIWSVPLNGAVPTDSAPRPVLGRTNGSPLGSENGRGSLRVVASGGNERGARVARSPNVPELLTRLGSDADIVILDTPPALATVEMAELSRTVDVVLIVVRHSRVTRRSLVTLNRRAEGWQSEILGAVLVDAPPEEDDYYYYKS